MLFIKQAHWSGRAVCLSSEAHLACNQSNVPLFFIHMHLAQGQIMRKYMTSVVMDMWARIDGHQSEVSGTVMRHEMSHLVTATT